MSAPKHTPGPWGVSADGIWAVSPLNAHVRLATVTSFSPMNGIDSRANAHLIAAAPELLEALQFAISFFDQLTPDDTERMRLAVAKATGSAA